MFAQVFVHAKHVDLGHLEDSLHGIVAKDFPFVVGVL
jgi:hypothetical protein